MYKTALYKSCITICFFGAVFACFDIKLCKESLPPVCQAVCGFVSFIKMWQKKTSVINSNSSMKIYLNMFQCKPDLLCSAEI